MNIFVIESTKLALFLCEYQLFDLILQHHNKKKYSFKYIHINIDIDI